ncbi:hypothetical protein [Collinsella ihumii]|uniref:Uncharacterized protein n=1 Tax=Collinsella ihumii TaxID=1720204 RepID=A0AAW7K1T1_9ACTN|nr:hypothetical protein [Collinsella ihumii]MDN0069157.1 hypothetical protein [Collinsella ihumii]
MEENETRQDITVVNDGQGLLFLGDPQGIKRWLDEQGLTSKQFTTKAIKTAGDALGSLGEAKQQSGRWVKLTKESAELVKKYGKPGTIQKGVAQNAKGRALKWLEFYNPSQLFTPAMAAGVGGMMTQMALEQAIQEITDYLAAIDEKVDDLLQDQKDTTIASLMGAALEVDEAAAVRDATGTLSDTAWSKVSPCAQTTSRALAYALTKLKGLSDKAERAKSIEDVGHAVEKLPDETRAWLDVIARSIQTRDRLSVIELERAYAELPEVLEQHRAAIVEARKHRLTNVQNGIGAFRQSLEGTAQRLRDQKLFHPRIVNRSLEIIDTAVKDIDGFAEQLNIEISQKTIERARAWNELAGEAIVEVAGGAAANAVELGGKMADGAQAIGGAIADGAGTLGEAASKGIAELGAGASEGAKALGEALSNVDVSQVLDALPIKLPFGKK